MCRGIYLRRLKSDNNSARSARLFYLFYHISFFGYSNNKLHYLSVYNYFPCLINVSVEDEQSSLVLSHSTCWVQWQSWLILQWIIKLLITYKHINCTNSETSCWRCASVSSKIDIFQATNFELFLIKTSPSAIILRWYAFYGDYTINIQRSWMFW